MKGIITVVLKQDILDPQGRAVMNSLQGLGYDEVQGVRIGKSIEIELNGISPDEAMLDCGKCVNQSLSIRSSRITTSR